MTTHDWTDDERDRAQTVIDADARALRNKDTTIKDRIVNPETCREWRDELAGTPRNAETIDTEYGVATVSKHVSGRCHHDPGEVGIPLERPDGGRWKRARMITTESRSGVYHTRVCTEFPESVRRMEPHERRKEWRVCRECSGEVPEAKPVPEAGDD